MTLQAEVDTFLAHVERGEARRAVDDVLALRDSGLSCADIVTEVLVPVQLEVGTRWATGRWGVADEHLATAAVDDALGALSARLDLPGQAMIALCSAEGEWHVTPLRMGALVLREQGWRVRLLGASAPADHVRDTLRHLGADVVAVHCVMAASLHGVPAMADAAHDLGLPVLAAGRGFGTDERRALRLGCDGWAPDVLSGAGLASAWLDAPPDRHHTAPSTHRAALDALAGQRTTIVQTASRRVAERHGASGGARRAPSDLRQDLDLLLDAAATALLVDDEEVVVDLVGWLEVVLVSRGLPVAVVGHEVEALAEVVAAELPALAALLEGQVRRG